MARGVLLDTCTISELQKKKPDPNVLEVFGQLNDQTTFLSVMVVAEIEKGILRHPSTEFRLRLREWLRRLEKTYQVLPFNRKVARVWSSLMAKQESVGFNRALADSFIIATAISYDLSIFTRNTKDFEWADINVINPWNQLAD